MAMPLQSTGALHEGCPATKVEVAGCMGMRRVPWKGSRPSIHRKPRSPGTNGARTWAAWKNIAAVRFAEQARRQRQACTSTVIT